jgi:hypothetical protein
MGKEKVKWSLFADDMILHLNDPKNSTKKLLNIINTLIKAAKYKTNLQKSIVFYIPTVYRTGNNLGKQSHLK